MNMRVSFDRTVYDLLVSELGAADVAEVLCAFLVDTSSKLERLAAPTVDRLEIRREAHSIKSSSATFGFLELSRRAKQLESDAEAMNTEELRGAVDELRQSFVLVLRLADSVLANEIAETAR